MKKALFMVALIALSFALTACGGSSGSDDCPPPVKTLSGCVSGAPIAGAKVFAKLNCLREEYKKYEYKDKALLVGKTNDKGCIIFDEEALAKLDRTKNVSLYSKGGKQFNCAIDCDGSGCAPCGGSSSCDECDDTSCAFKGQLRAILAPGATEVYLTLPNTIVHDMVVDKKVPFEKAQNLVRKLICCVMCIDALPDPLGNPCLDLVKYEYIAQALLLGMGTDEEGLACDTQEYKDALAETVCDIAEWKYCDLKRFEEVEFEAVKCAMLPVLGDEYASQIAALTEEDVLTDEAYTIELKRGKRFGPAWYCPAMNCYLMPYYPCYRDFKFEVKSKANKCGDACDNKGKFRVKELPSCGKLKTCYNGEVVKVGQEFEGDVKFKYELTEKESKDLRGEKVTFTFEPVDGCYTDDLVICVKYLGIRDFAIKSLKHHRKCKDPKTHPVDVREELKSSQIYDVYKLTATNDKEFDTSNPSMITIEGGVKGTDYAYIEKDALAAFLTFDTELVGILDEGETVVVKVEAPTGFKFEYVESKEAASGKRVVIDEDGKLVVTFTASNDDYDVSALTKITLTGDDTANLRLRTLSSSQPAKLNAMHVKVYKDDMCVGGCDPEAAEEGEEKNANGAQFYIVADGTEALPQSITMDAKEIKLTAGDPTTIGNAFADIAVTSWDTLAGKNCSYDEKTDASKWFVEVVDSTSKDVGFVLGSGGQTLAKTLSFAAFLDSKLVTANASKKLKVTFKGQPFKLSTEPSAKLKFKYLAVKGEEGQKDTYLETTSVLTIKPAPKQPAQ